MKKNNIYKKRVKILESAKKHVPFDGWNERIFKKISDDLIIPLEEVMLLFPDGYKDLLEFYLEEAENEIVKSINKLDLSSKRTHERIFEITKLYFEKNKKNKELIRKTFFTLLLPQNAPISTLSLFRTADNIWYFAGDSSTNFNFYTKRFIIAGIYSSTLIFWINDNTNSLKKTEAFLMKKIRSTSIIPKIKSSVQSLIKNSKNLFYLDQGIRK